MTQKTCISLIIAASTAIFSSCANTSSGTTSPDTTTTPEVAPTVNGYPVGKHIVDPTTGAPVKDHYISPFSPYNPIVAKGFKSGQLAGDPSTVQTDPKTGKPNSATMKVFRLP